MSNQSLKRMLALLGAVFVLLAGATIAMYLRSESPEYKSELVPNRTSGTEPSTAVSGEPSEPSAAATEPPTELATEAPTEAPTETPTEAPTEAETAAEQHIIYLTFDDGPGPYTERLLNILKKHGVKATFFVTSAYPEFNGLIAREADEGHAVGVHTYTHNYAKIYESDAAFWDDYKKMQEVIVQQTGQETRLMRFPGGSSNTISASYSEGIMTRLAAQAEEKGYAYFDWNCASGDAGQTTESAQVLQNCKNAAENYRQAVLLCHDVKEYTVNAMDEFIGWALAQGYEFRALTKESYAAHHRIAN